MGINATVEFTRAPVLPRIPNRVIITGIKRIALCCNLFSAAVKKLDSALVSLTTLKQLQITITERIMLLCFFNPFNGALKNSRIDTGLLEI